MIIATKEQYDKFLDEVLAFENEYIGIDTETEEFTDKKFLASDLALEGVGIYSGQGNKKVKGYILVQVLDDRFQEVLDKKKLILHNAKFDLTVFECFGYNIKKCHFEDTLIMAWLASENRHSYRLKDLAGTVLKVKEDKITRFGDVGKKPTPESYGMLADTEYHKGLKQWIATMGAYCIKDCEYTYKLFYKFRDKLKKDVLDNKLWEEYRKLEIPFIEVLRNMESTGIRVDKEYLLELGTKLDSRLIDMKANIYKAVGREIDINSPKQLREYFFGEKKYVLPEDLKTPTGQVSTNVEAMKYLCKVEKDKVAELVISYRELSKLNSTYVKGMLQLVRKDVIYASFRQTGTITGRISSSHPNLQNIPRRDDEWNIRKAFIAREGYKFIISDYSQIELRLMGWFSKDQTVIQTYQDGGDIHQATAEKVGCDRVSAKAINFGINYGMSAFSLSKTLKVTQDEAQKFIDKYFAQFPNVRLFQKQAINTLRKNYAVHTIAKRKRRFKEYAIAKKTKDWRRVGALERQAVNSIIQGSASDVIKIAMRNIHKRLQEEFKDANILIQIHDELIVECKEADAKKVEALVKHEMETAVDLKIIPLVTEPMICDRWIKG